MQSRPLSRLPLPDVAGNAPWLFFDTGFSAPVIVAVRGASAWRLFPDGSTRPADRSVALSDGEPIDGDEALRRLNASHGGL